MQTFSSHQQVRSIDEMLESTLHVQAKNARIAELEAENADLRAKLWQSAERNHKLLTLIGESANLIGAQARIRR